MATRYAANCFALAIIGMSLFIPSYIKSSVQNDSVTFLENEPAMDGIIYNEVLNIPARSFNTTELTSESCMKPDASYRLAFGLSFLYIMVEYSSDEITFRDRAYQNGDGFIVTIAKPKENNEPADEFYVMGFSPGNNNSSIKPWKFIWYRNIGLSFQPLKETKFTSSVVNGKVYLQALIYWKEIYPFHPAFYEDGIGFNLCFIKACGQSDKAYYFDVADNNMQSEQSLREYRLLNFSKPRELILPQLYCLLSRNYLSKKDDLSLMACCVGKPSCVVTLDVSITADDYSYKQSDQYALFNTKGCTKIYYDIPVSNLPFKNYTLSWKAGAYSYGSMKFTLLPEFDIEKRRAEIEKVKGKVCDGSYSTMRFMLDDIAARHGNLKIYESCPEILKDLTDLNTYIGSAGKDTDTLIRKEGVIRRGFLSAADNTYRPYTVRIPAKYDKYRKYPLLVYLHGSGDDDKVASKTKSLTKGNFIELYPNGRGTSNVYSSPESQFDIKEAIDDVIKNYQIDTDHIILSGFSMGGYGVYRTYIEHPEIYKAMAVFSGHPDLANKWLGDGHLNFLNEEQLVKFVGKKMFIYHGTEDLNCPFELTQELVEKLKKAGAEIDFVTEPAGHSMPSENSMKLFQNWLDGIISSAPQ